MRSVRYLLRGKPHNLDDCIDFSKKEKPSKVSLDLVTDEYISEMYILKHFLGLYEWKFSNMIVKFDKVYGGYFFHETEEKQKSRIDNSNYRLKEDIKKVERLNITIENKEKEFNCSMAYIQKQKGAE